MLQIYIPEELKSLVAVVMRSIMMIPAVATTFSKASVVTPVHEMT